jgi:hypothetical protein
MSTYSCNKDDGVVRVAQRSACCKIIRRGSGRRRDADSVCLHSSKMFIIPKKLDTAHCSIRPPVDHNFIQDIVRSLRFVRVVVLALLADQFFNEVATRVLSALGPHYSGFETKAERHCNSFVEGSGDGLWVLLVVEFCEEAEGAKRESENRRNYTLEEPRRVEDRAVAA